MFGLKRRRDPKPPPEPVSGSGHWVAIPTGPGQFFHTFKPRKPNEAQRLAAEAKAVAQFDQALDPGSRYPVAAPRRSCFNSRPDPDRFPG